MLSDERRHTLKTLERVLTAACALVSAVAAVRGVVAHLVYGDTVSYAWTRPLVGLTAV